MSCKRIKREAIGSSRTRRERTHTSLPRDVAGERNSAAAHVIATSFPRAARADPDRFQPSTVAPVKPETRVRGRHPAPRDPVQLTDGAHRIPGPQATEWAVGGFP